MSKSRMHTELGKRNAGGFYDTPQAQQPATAHREQWRLCTARVSAQPQQAAFQPQPKVVIC